MLAFPTIQTCEKGETAWTEVAADGQDADELESPAPAFEILPASEEGDHTTTRPPRSRPSRRADEATDAGPTPTPRPGAPTDDGDSSALGWAGLGAGLLGLVAGGLALARTRSTS